MITSVTEKDVIKQATTREFCKTMLSSFEANMILFRWMMRFSRMENAGHRNLQLEWRDFLGTPNTEEGLKAAVSKGACYKALERRHLYGIF